MHRFEKQGSMSETENVSKQAGYLRLPWPQTYSHIIAHNYSILDFRLDSNPNQLLASC